MANEKFNIKKTVLNKENYKKVIDNSFNELIPPPEEVVVVPTVEDFFTLYNELFFDIPKNGENSHETIVNRSSEYIGEAQISEEIEALVDEINLLREELNEANENIRALTSGGVEGGTEGALADLGEGSNIISAAPVSTTSTTSNTSTGY